MRPTFNQIRHPEWTDLAVVIGPDVRWVEADYEDLQGYAPEVLLGHRVLLTTHADAFRTRGRRVAKVIVLDSPRRFTPEFQRGLYEILARAVWDGGQPKVEEWHVHRGTGIYRLD